MQLTPKQVLYGYSIGIFPMAHQDENNKIYWYEPEMRGIIPLNGLKISRSLKQTLRSKKYHVTFNRDFEKVIRACSRSSQGKERPSGNVWISEEIISVYCELHEMGYAFSFETRNEYEELVGGLYGVAMGKAFFGESMFHLERDASKVALVFLVQWLKANNFILLDTQFVTNHLRSLGAIEIAKEEYKKCWKKQLDNLKFIYLRFKISSKKNLVKQKS
ncbi:MAG: leucyl/phenylalanyl-tRNA--protein transferase [Bacteroidia bacterium]